MLRVCCLINVSTDKFHVLILSDAKHEHTTTILPPTWDSSFHKSLSNCCQLFLRLIFDVMITHGTCLTLKGYNLCLITFLNIRRRRGNDNFYSFPLFENNNEFQIQISNGFFFHVICVICFVYFWNLFTVCG